MNSFWKASQYFFAALIFVVTAVYLSNWVTSRNTPNSEPKPGERTEVVCSADFLSYKTLSEREGHVVTLIDSRKNMFAESGEFVNSQIVITKNETEESKVACGYLFVKSGTTSYGPLRTWENLYINPNEFGGHINSENQFGPGDSRNYSEYVFALNSMEYWRNRSERIKGNLLKADWAALLNVQNTVSFDIALNTEDKTGFIDQLAIAYKCWNPKTGEENDGCKINIQSKEDTQKSELN